MGFFNWFSKNERAKRKQAREHALLGKAVSKKPGAPLKLGLALAGGGTRGYGHIGAIKALNEYGIKFDYVAGTSVGALIGAMFANGLSIEEMEAGAVGFKLKDITTSKIPLIPSKTDKLEALVAEYVGDIDISELKTPFVAVAVDIVTGEEVHLSRGSLAKAVAGSCAMPGLFNPVVMGDMHLLDGCLKNTMPSDVVREMGADIVIAIDLNSKRGYGTESIKYIEVMKVALRVLMKTAAIKGYVASDYVVTPDLGKFKQISVKGGEEMLEEGYRATIAAMPEILKLVGAEQVNPDTRKMAEKLKRYEDKTKVDPKDKKILDAIENDEWEDF